MQVLIRLREWREENKKLGLEPTKDELRKNNVNIDITILSQHIHYVRDIHEDMYNEMANRLNSDELLNVFNEMNVNGFRRVVAYLALVYRMNISEEDVIREAVLFIELRLSVRDQGCVI